MRRADHAPATAAVATPARTPITRALLVAETAAARSLIPPPMSALIIIWTLWSYICGAMTRTSAYATRPPTTATNRWESSNRVERRLTPGPAGTCIRRRAPSR